MLDKISDMTKITLDEGDVLVVSVDCGGMPPAESNEYMKAVKDYLTVYFFSNKIAIIPDNIRINVIKPPPEKKDGSSISES